MLSVFLFLLVSGVICIFKTLILKGSNCSVKCPSSTHSHCKTYRKNGITKECTDYKVSKMPYKRNTGKNLGGNERIFLITTSSSHDSSWNLVYRWIFFSFNPQDSPWVNATHYPLITNEKLRLREEMLTRLQQSQHGAKLQTQAVWPHHVPPRFCTLNPIPVFKLLATTQWVIKSI